MEGEDDGAVESRTPPPPQQQHKDPATPAAARGHGDGGSIPCHACGYLPPHLVELIMRRFSLRSTVRLQLVSKEWRAAARLVVASRRRIPWLFLYSWSRYHSWDHFDYYLVDIASGGESETVEVKLPDVVPSSNPTVKLPETVPISFRGSHGGWLILQHQETHQISLLDPLSKARIDLPRLRRPSYRAWNVLLHTPATPTSPDCTVLFMEHEEIHMWRPGQKTWTSAEMPDAMATMHMKALALSEGKLYAVDSRDSTWAVDILSFSVTKLHRPPYVGPPSGQRSLARTLALGESRGEVLLVQRDWPAVGVFRLDVPSSTWIKLESLGGNRALFIGCPGVLIAAEVPPCRGDRIYFIDSPLCHAFNMESKMWTILELPSSCSGMCGGTWTFPALLH